MVPTRPKGYGWFGFIYWLRMMVEAWCKCSGLDGGSRGYELSWTATKGQASGFDEGRG